LFKERELEKDKELKMLQIKFNSHNKYKEQKIKKDKKLKIRKRIKTKIKDFNYKI